MRPGPQLEVAPAGGRLDSWKDIASYLGRSERTVRRWETTEQLPVHRHAHEKRGSVYAFRWELDEWRASRTLPAAEPEETEPGGPEPAAAAAVLVAAAGGYVVAGRGAPASHATAMRPLPNVKPEALRALQKGASFSRDLSRKSVEAGIRNLQDAVRLEPGFAPSWSVLGSAYTASSWFTERPGTETYAQARSAARKALELDSRSGAWKVLGLTAHLLDWDQAEAERDLRKAIELGPRDATAQKWFAVFLIDCGRWQDAEEHVQAARERDPAWLESDTTLGDVRALEGDLDGAIAEYRRVLETQPHYGLAHLLLGRAYLARHEDPTAIAELREGNELLGREPFSMADLGYGLARSGQPAEAKQILGDMMQRRQDYYPAFAIAEVELGLRSEEAALDWSERASGERLFG